jgi:hypothetical protein
MTCCRWPGLLALLLLAGGLLVWQGLGVRSEPPAAEVQVEAVKYPALGDAIKKLKGKVVVVDFWSTT